MQQGGSEALEERVWARLGYPTDHTDHYYHPNPGAQVNGGHAVPNIRLLTL